MERSIAAANCCRSGTAFEGLLADCKRRLWLVIAIDAGMFFAGETAPLAS